MVSVSPLWSFWPFPSGCSTFIPFLPQTTLSLLLLGSQTLPDPRSLALQPTGKVLREGQGLGRGSERPGRAGGGRWVCTGSPRGAGVFGRLPPGPASFERCVGWAGAAGRCPGLRRGTEGGQLSGAVLGAASPHRTHPPPSWGLRLRRLTPADPMGPTGPCLGWLVRTVGLGLTSPLLLSLSLPVSSLLPGRCQGSWRSGQSHATEERP